MLPQEIFARRLKKFYESTSPLISYYASQASPLTKLVTLSGTTSDEIWLKLERVVNECLPIRPHTASRTEVRERERDKSIREAVGLNSGAGGRQYHMKTKGSLS
jgi:nucleoside-triphosphate--adenylate kinase